MATTRSDAEIRRDVAAALRANPRLDATHVSIDVVGGTVRLRGSVPDWEQWALAAETAMQVKDALRVENDLRVPAGARRPDQGITYDVLAALERDRFLDASRISVETTDGIVHLSGLLDSDEHRAAAERDARAVPGVAGVANEIEVRPAATWNDREVSETVMAVVASDPRIDARNVAADVQGGVVHLRGTVPTDEQKRLAAELARQAPGVRRVVDELKVVGRA